MCSSNPDQYGMLLFQDNSNTVHLNGGANTDYQGTIYAPYSYVDINGGSGTSGIFKSQVIGDTVQMNGNGDLTIAYFPDQNYKAPIPPKVWLAE